MVVLLSKRKSSLLQMIQSLNSSNLDKQLLTLKSQEVQLWLPKFKLETT